MTDSRTLPPRRENDIEREEREARLFFFREEGRAIVVDGRWICRTCLQNRTQEKSDG